jgi:hypothetical protein
MIDFLPPLMLRIDERSFDHASLNLKNEFEELHDSLPRLLLVLNHVIHGLGTRYRPQSGVKLVRLKGMRPLLLDLKELPQIGHPLLI